METQIDRGSHEDTSDDPRSSLSDIRVYPVEGRGERTYFLLQDEGRRNKVIDGAPGVGLDPVLTWHVVHVELPVAIVLEHISIGYYKCYRDASLNSAERRSVVVPSLPNLSSELKAMMTTTGEGSVGLS